MKPNKSGCIVSTAQTVESIFHGSFTNLLSSLAVYHGALIFNFCLLKHEKSKKKYSKNNIKKLVK